MSDLHIHKCLRYFLNYKYLSVTNKEDSRGEIRNRTCSVIVAKSDVITWKVFGSTTLSDHVRATGFPDIIHISILLATKFYRIARNLHYSICFLGDAFASDNTMSVLYIYRVKNVCDRGLNQGYLNTDISEVSDSWCDLAVNIDVFQCQKANGNIVLQNRPQTFMFMHICIQYLHLPFYIAHIQYYTIVSNA